MAAVPFVVELASRIALNTSRVSEYLAANDHPQPSFHLDAPPCPVPRDAQEIEALRQAVLRDTAELRDLMLGPRDYLRSSGFKVSFISASCDTSEILTAFNNSKMPFYLSRRSLVSG